MIERFRKAGASVVLKDGTGKALADRSCRIRQLSSDFAWGCNGLCLRQLGASNALYEAKLSEFFNMVTTTFCPGVMEPKKGPTRAEKPGRITLEGNDFRAHVQGVCTDGTNIYWSMTYDLVKTDMSGRELARYSDKFHMGDLCWHNGRIYVGVNRTAERGSRRGDEVWVFDPGKLERVKTYPTPQTIWCNNGIEWYGDRFWIVGCTPKYSRYNYVFEYTEDFRFVQCRPIESGWTNLGVQTICLWGGKMLFGCYGAGKDPQMPHKASTFAVDVKDLTRKTLNIEFPYVIPLAGKAEQDSSEGMLVLDGGMWTAHGTVIQKTADGSGDRKVGRLFGAYIRRDKDLEHKLARAALPQQ